MNLYPADPLAVAVLVAVAAYLMTCAGVGQEDTEAPLNDVPGLPSPAPALHVPLALSPRRAR